MKPTTSVAVFLFSIERERWRGEYKLHTAFETLSGRPLQSWCAITDKRHSPRCAIGYLS
jgi:hypothetical protein